jgi:glycosyltransferase involved in cell wall biosynthesis
MPLLAHREINSDVRDPQADQPVVLDARVVTGSGGGPEKTILNSPRFLAGSGYRMLCAYMHPPGDPGFETLRRRADALQAPLLSIPDRGPWDCRVVATLRELCRRERVTIWHGHDYKSNVLGLLLRRSWPMRLVTTVHGWVKHTSRTPLYYALDRFSLPRYERVLCVSEDLRTRCLRCGVAEDRCVLIENGIDTTQYARTRRPEDARSRLGLPPHRRLIGAVGRLSEEKGFDRLIRAVDALVRRGLDVGLVIVGDGDQRAPLAECIRELGLQDRVTLAGFQPDLTPFYEAMNVFALSSLREGLPNVLLEAMAMQVPVVATRVAGIPQLVQHEENGLLVAPSSVIELEQAVSRLLDDPESAVRLGRSGRATVETSYSFAARMQRMSDLYDDLLGERRL